MKKSAGMPQQCVPSKTALLARLPHHASAHSLVVQHYLSLSQHRRKRKMDWIYRQHTAVYGHVLTYYAGTVFFSGTVSFGIYK